MSTAHDVSIKDNAAVEIWQCTCGAYFVEEWRALDHMMNGPVKALCRKHCTDPTCDSLDCHLNRAEQVTR